MPINFPNSPSNNDLYTDGSVTWKYSSTNNSWLVTTFGNAGLENATPLDNTIVGLNRVGTAPNEQNVQVPAVGLEFDPAVRNLKIRSLGVQSANLLTIVDNTDATLNGFNQRGVLLKAGMIFHSASQPQGLNNADAGQLWFNTSDNGLYAWSGGAWLPAGSGVTLNTNQSISGAKTFSNNVILSSTATIRGEGSGKSIVLSPTNTASPSPANIDALTVAHDEATFTVPVTLSSVTSTTKPVLATLADSQVISGLKTFTAGIKLGNTGSVSRIYCSDSTVGYDPSDAISIQPNLSTTGRYIKLFSNNDGNENNGITIRPKNYDNQGAFNVDGNQRITGNLTVIGNISTTGSFAAVTTVYGSLNQAGTYVAPTSLGSLTFTINSSATNLDDRGIQISNNSTSTVKFYVKREQVQASGYVYGIRLITMAPNSQYLQKVSAGEPANISPTGSVTSTSISATTGIISIATHANPCTMTFTLAT